jgi:hypothetical protein
MNDGSNNGPEVKIDDAHVSGHFMSGQFDVPLTQKIHAGGKTIRLDTPVDGNGNVGETTFHQ